MTLARSQTPSRGWRLGGSLGSPENSWPIAHDVLGFQLEGSSGPPSQVSEAISHAGCTLSMG